MAIDTKSDRASYTTKLLGSAKQDIEIARERGIILEKVFSHDHLLTSHLFDGDFTSVTQDKIKLMAHLEAYLIDDVGLGLNI